MKLKTRVTLRLSDEQARKLSELRGYAFKWDPSEIIRLAIERLHAEYVAHRDDPERVKLTNCLLDKINDQAEQVPVSDIPPSEELLVRQDDKQPEGGSEKETSKGKRKSTRRAPGPKPEDNHRPKKGASNGAKPGSKRPARSGTASASAGGQKPAKARKKGQPHVGAGLRPGPAGD